MAEETNHDAKEEEGKGFSPLIKKLLIWGIFIIIPACLGLAVVQFVIKPMIEEPDAPAVDLGEIIPFEAVSVDFPDLQASLQAKTSSDPLLLLIYSISLVCDSPETSQMVLDRKSYFDAKIDELHRGRTESDFADKLIIENIEMQIKIEANKILKRINPEGDNMIIEVMHSKLTIFAP